MSSGRSIESFISWLDAFNPTRSYLLGEFKLDKILVRGRGHWLYDRDGLKYLDFFSQYGAVSLGHNHPELCETLTACLREELPAMVQPLLPVAAQELATKLAKITPGELAHVIFTNSGAESVEAAIKLTRAKTGRRIILSAENGFHGKTLGALSATAKTKYQKPFGAPVQGFEYVPYGDLDALEARLRKGSELPAAFLVESVQGEGGVVVAPPGYIASALALCRQYQVQFVLDEIQTGLGRTGEMFSVPEGVGAPDVLLLAKALGGGLLPIGACIATQKSWDHEFGYLHSSTFANNNLGCKVGLKVIELLARDDYRLVRHVASDGAYMIGRLQELQSRFPGVIKEVRGRGFLAGVEFYPFRGSDSYVMSYFSHSDFLLPVLCGYLFNVHGILTAPVFNHFHVLRLEPPFTVGKAEIDRMIVALEVLCDAIERRSYYSILRYLIGSSGPEDTGKRYAVFNAPNPKPPAVLLSEKKGRFAFLMHYTDDQDILDTDPSFEQFTPEELDRWKSYVENSPAEVFFHLEHIQSPTGATAQGWLVGIPMLPERMVRRGRRKMLPLLRDATEIARDRGAQILGLGAFTSIVSRGGESLLGHGIAVTSGNVLTSVMSVEGIIDVITRLGLRLDGLHVAVVGATGAIGRLTAMLLADHVASLTLVGNNSRAGGEERCRAVAKEIHQRGGGLADLPIHCTVDLDAALPDMDVIVSATSSSYELIQSHHLKSGAVVCDIARPRNVSRNVVDQRPDVLVFEGGLVELPQRVHFGANVQVSRPGIQLACLSECILLALEGDFSDHSIGQELSLEEAAYFKLLSHKHDFRAAPPQWLARELGEADFDRVRSALAEMVAYQ